MYGWNEISFLFIFVHAPGGQFVIPTGLCSDKSIFRQVDIPTGRYSDRSIFRQVAIPTGRYSYRSLFRQLDEVMRIILFILYYSYFTLTKLTRHRGLYYYNYNYFITRFMMLRFWKRNHPIEANVDNMC